MTDARTVQTLRYVVLRHEGVDPAHFDLMFETAPGSPLATWRSPIWPVDHAIILTRLPDHRRDYLTYEGSISGNRGRVRRVAEGLCTIGRRAETWVVEFAPPGVLPALLMLDTGAGEWSARPDM